MCCFWVSIPQVATLMQVFITRNCLVYNDSWAGLPYTTLFLSINWFWFINQTISWASVLHQTSGHIRVNSICLCFLVLAQRSKPPQERGSLDLFLYLDTTVLNYPLLACPCSCRLSGRARPKDTRLAILVPLSLSGENEQDAAAHCSASEGGSEHLCNAHHFQWDWHEVRALVLLPVLFFLQNSWTCPKLT